ncbi:MAG: hypothetical protein WAU39_03285 [Polyangiales bacterium]
MANTKRPTGKSWNTPRTLGLRIGAVLLALVGCDRQPAEEATSESTAPVREDLLIGYGLLADTLSDESHLGTLDLFKTLTLNAPNDAIAKMMQTLSEASTRRAAELSKLRHLAPDVSDEPTQASPIGDAITAVAKEFGKSEMLSRSGGFDVRFVLLQAQATRMVAAMATATARFDPNPKRKKWLKSLANEYEGYRGDLIKYLSVRADSP